MAIDFVTAVQYSGYFQDNIRKMSEQGKVSPETLEAIFQKRLEEERKRIQPVVNIRRRVIEHYIIEKDIKRKRIEYREFGKIVNILV